MNLNVLLNIGNESYTGDEAPKSLLDEMMEEIGIESEIDNNIYDTEIACVNAAAAIVENVYVAMAEKECAVEGANPLEIYRGFGLEGALLNTVGQEAISDVVKRRAYSGVAQIKSLINTLISWVIRILGLSANTKKIFKSLAEKAKKIRKEVAKARSNFAAKAAKNGEEKEYTREIADYLGEAAVSAGKFGINTVVDVYGVIKSNMEYILTTVSVDTNGNLTDNTNRVATRSGTDLDNDKKEGYAEKIKNWKEDSKNEVSGDALFDKIFKGLDALVSSKNNKTDIAKSAEKAKKHLEKIRKDLENNNKNANVDLTTGHNAINKWISIVSTDAAFMNMFAKFYVKVADELFTDAKWLIMKAA